MNYAEYKIANSFDEIIKDNGKHLYEVYVISERGYTPKRYLCTISIRNDGWRKVIIIKPYDKFGREIHGWYMPFGVSFCANEYKDMNYCLGSVVLKKQGYNTFALSKDAVYQYCMGMIRNKMQELRKKEIEIHKAIYSL